MTRPPFPRRVYLVDRWLTVTQVTAEEMREVVGEGRPAVGAWHADSGTIYVLKTLPITKRWRALGHEQGHALIDLLDQT